jgi:hypothetical protein
MDTETRVERAAGAAPRLGKLRIGAHVPTVGGARASIPARFETVLNHDARESNGFGRRTFRFDEPVNDLPGPGAYGRSRAITNKSQLHLSTSTKGSAAFASSTKAGSKLPTGAYTPGPAAYDPQKPVKGVPSVTKSATGPSPAFKPPTEKRLLRVTAVVKDVPGPGAYRPEDAATAKPGGRFTTLAPREVGPMTKPAMEPGPGEYLPETALNPIAASASHVRPAPRAMTSPAGDMKAKAEARPGLPPAMDSDALAGPLPAVVREAARERKERDLQHKVAGALKPVEPKPTPKSAAFADTCLDRFGKPTVRYTAGDDGNLGPGCYETEKRPRRMLISSSWALSAVERGGQKERYAVPGPAYYAPPAQPKKSSHHMLSDGYWS